MKKDIDLAKGVLPAPTGWKRFLPVATSLLLLLLLMVAIYHYLSLYRVELAERTSAAAAENEKLFQKAEPLIMAEMEIEKNMAELAFIEELNGKKTGWSKLFEDIHATASGITEVDLFTVTEGERMIIEGRAPSLEAVAELINLLLELLPCLHDLRLENAGHGAGGGGEQRLFIYPDEETSDVYRFRLSCEMGEEGGRGR